MSWSARGGVAALTLVCALAAAGCSSSLAEGPDEPPPPPAPPSAVDDFGGLDRSHEFPGHVAVTVTGARRFQWQGEQTVHVSRVGNPNVSANLLAVGFGIPEPLDPRRHFRWAVELIDAYDDEPDTFTIAAHEAPAGKVRSGALLVYAELSKDVDEASKDDVSLWQQFDRLRQACTVQVGEGEFTGTLHCPAVADATGAVVSFTVRWRKAAP